jgi:HAD superfamily phosphoserine phosphatase-like hydrolase
VAAGDQVVVVSANFDFFLTPLMEMFGVSRIIATKAEVQDGAFTGRIIGGTCKGKRKISCVIDVLGEDALRKSTVYGDGEDKDLMSSAEQSFSAETIL